MMTRLAWAGHPSPRPSPRSCLTGRGRRSRSSLRRFRHELWQRLIIPFTSMVRHPVNRDAPGARVVQVVEVIGKPTEAEDAHPISHCLIPSQGFAYLAQGILHCLNEHLSQAIVLLREKRARAILGQGLFLEPAVHGSRFRA